MIARLKGTLIEKSPNRLVVDVGGVGYDVLVPLSTFYTLGEAGSGVTLRIHTHVREDVIALYSFGTGLEQDLFERLISVSGIGPKLALAVLSGIDSASWCGPSARRMSRASRGSLELARKPPSGSDWS